MAAVPRPWWGVDVWQDAQLYVFVWLTDWLLLERVLLTHLFVILSLYTDSGGCQPTENEGFIIKPQPISPSVKIGREAYLHCGVSDNTSVEIHWTKDGERIQNSVRRRMEGSNLRIIRVDPELDSGEFQCVATNTTSGMTLSSDAVMINMLWLGEAQVKLYHPSNPIAGSDLSLTCDVDGNPEPRHAEWFHNGVRMHRGAQVSFRHFKMTLANVTARNNGVYSCKASNDVALVWSSTHFVLELKAPHVPSIRVRPRDTQVAEGSQATFDCVFDDAAIVEWYAHNQDVPLTNGSRTVIWPNNSLTLNDVAKNDEGMFKCVGIPMHKGVPQQVFAARMGVAWIGNFEPEVSIEPQLDDLMYVVALGSQARLLCLPPEGTPSPKWYWTFPNGSVVADTGRTRVNVESELQIDHVKLQDAGNYSCHAENIAAKRTLTVQLVVTTPPEVHDHISSKLQLHEGTSHVLKCSFRASAWPLTSVTWTNVDSPMVSLDFDPEKGALILKNITMRDAGRYLCSVSSKGFPTVVSKPVVVEVIERLKFYPVPMNTNLEFKSIGRIPCRSRGAQRAIVRWVKINPEDEQRSVPLPTNLRQENNVLIFEPVTYDDGGQYRCVASTATESINVTITVTVGVSPRFTVFPNSTEVLEGHPVWLNCQAEGDPEPHIHWDRNSRANSLSHETPRIQILHNGTLFIQEAYMRDTGQYGCTAGNRGGFNRTEVSLVVASSKDFVPSYNLSGDSGDGTISKTIGITLGAAGVYMILVLSLMLYCRVRRARRKAALLGSRPKGNSSDEENRLDGAVGSGELQSNKLLPSAGSSESGSVTSKNSKLSVERLHFPRKDLSTIMLLGRGDFGDVYLAKAAGIAEETVMVKSLHSQEEATKMEFRRQAEMFTNLNHQGICRVVGMCAETEPLLVMYDYTDWGDLKRFLAATRKDAPTSQGSHPPPLTSAQCMGVCHQVALAMEYLSNHRFVHKDLATRNCLVTSKLDVKISSPSLSKDTYSAEYFHYRDQLVPLKWAPAEAVIEDQWSSKSDVYAYAVFCWEVFTQAQMPHEDISNPDFLYRLEVHEIQWEPPAKCPPAMQDLMRSCWRILVTDRPSFSEISSQVGQIFVDTNV
ncbi:inactive tyrosine-protein kinase 7 [Galendromus occidentalis]|uniref:Inactive tyrosine-protein kinase 7 n=1 Tax=Galendromus occidentalis TaxID=34638 RepID=A0AAJ7L796_9ACAR|nr:inactive tyrosine-protein kinase 7 [Galendromus occidentalis]